MSTDGTNSFELDTCIATVVGSDKKNAEMPVKFICNNLCKGVTWGGAETCKTLYVILPKE